MNKKCVLLIEKFSIFGEKMPWNQSTKTFLVSKDKVSLRVDILINKVKFFKMKYSINS